MKKILLFLACLLPWFLSAIFVTDTSFYQSINLPSFAPKPIVFSIVWPILYFLIALNSYTIIKEYGIKYNKDYIHNLFVHYIFNQLYPFLFFKFHSLFGSFVDVTAVLISSLFLYYEAKSLNSKSSKLLLPYLFWNVFALILSVTIFFINL